MGSFGVLDDVEITFLPPPVPLLSEWQDVNTAWFCNRSTLVDPDYCLDQDLCMCTHLINVPLGKVRPSWRWMVAMVMMGMLVVMMVVVVMVVVMMMVVVVVVVVVLPLMMMMIMMVIHRPDRLPGPLFQQLGSHTDEPEAEEACTTPDSRTTPTSPKCCSGVPTLRTPSPAPSTPDPPLPPISPVS